MKRVLVLLAIMLSVVTVGAQEDLKAHIEGLGYVPLPEEYRATLKAGSVCPIAVPPGEVWEAYYSVKTDYAASWDQCLRYSEWSGWMTLEEGRYDVRVIDGMIFIIWYIHPLVSCNWFWYEDDCTRPDDDPQWIHPMWYVVCPDWDAFPRTDNLCIFDDGFESGDTSAWDRTVE